MSRAMSLKAKIRNIAKQKNIPAQVILQNYMFERLLVRLADSEYYEPLFNETCSLMYYGLTAPPGWEWFNSVRNEDRFKEYIERAKNMIDKQQ